VTLIVGIKCGDGIALGADGSATLGNIAETTVQQPVKKLSSINGELIVGVAGPVTFSQIYQAELKKLCKDGLLKKPEKALASIQDTVWARIEKEWKAASSTVATLGQNVAMRSVMSNAVVAMPILDEPSLFQFNHHCSPEEATATLPFISIGSGQKYADPFLAFLKRIFWPNGPPLLADGILAVLWTLEQAIRTNTSGLAHPIQILTLSKSGKQWTIVELGDAELEEHRQNIADAEQALANYKQEQTATASAAEVPTPDLS
jgi:ATP-dependent protease HslVU (ClpYQ) peptidase subunit